MKLNGWMKKQESSLLIAKGEYTASCSQILTQVSVASGDNAHRVDNAVALWDTGATSSFVSQRLIECLGLKKVGETDVRYANGKVETKDVYYVRLTFQPSGREISLHASLSDDTSQDFIIGMNIIRNGTFLLKPTDEGVKFTFEL